MGKEILNDKDQEIIFADKFIRDMTEEQFEALKRKEWVRTPEQFKRVKDMEPQNDLDRFYKFYYVKTSSFASGSQSFDYAQNETKRDLNKLWNVHERLQKVKLTSGDYEKMLDKYDSPDTFFYLDPPYPDRHFVGQSFEDFTEDDLVRLIDKLKGIKGKFILSLGTEHACFIPKGWHIKKVKTYRSLLGDEKDYRNWNEKQDYEIIVSKQEFKKHRLSASNMVVEVNDTGEDDREKQKVIRRHPTSIGVKRRQLTAHTVT